MGRPTKAVELYNKALFEQGLIKCFDCKEIKPLDDFGNNAGKWHGKMTRCKPCNVTQNRQRVDNRRADLNAFKQSQGCMMCGYNEDGSKLHFHHRDKSTKLFNIGVAVLASSQRLQEEIDKCDILCIDCHATYHNIVDRGIMDNSKSTLNK